MRTTTLLALLTVALVSGCKDEGTSHDGGVGQDAVAGQDAAAQSDAAVQNDAAAQSDAAVQNDAASDDPHVICVSYINTLRATKGRPAYGRWASAETCVDGQATSDEQNGDAHGSFGQCGESGQNECLGGGAAGIVNCLDMMWAEKDQPGCAGCDACADAYDPDCPGCDFYGDQTGDVCGHYVNMSALYFTEAACGFSSQGGWAAIDFR